MRFLCSAVFSCDDTRVRHTSWSVRRSARCQESEVEVTQIFREAGLLAGMRDWLQRSRVRSGDLLSRYDLSSCASSD